MSWHSFNFLLSSKVCLKGFTGKSALSWGRCYDHNFCQFSAKILAFVSKLVTVKFFQKTSSSLSKKRQIFRQICRQKIITPVLQLLGRGSGGHPLPVGSEQADQVCRFPRPETGEQGAS
jgi:hypothetical protein